MKQSTSCVQLLTEQAKIARRGKYLHIFRPTCVRSLVQFPFNLNPGVFVQLECLFGKVNKKAHRVFIFHPLAQKRK